MFESRLIPPPAEFTASANLDQAAYEKMYAESIADPEAFWGAQAERLSWFKKWDRVLEHDFARAKVKWFVGGKLNLAHNCLDRHLGGEYKNKAAIIWEPDNPNEASRTFTYQQLHREVGRAANLLKSQGVEKGDRVIIYLPMIPELAFTALACARIGAVHSVVFGGFSPESLLGRIEDCQPKLIVTSDAGFRGGKIIDMKANVDAALERTNHKVATQLVVRRVGESHHIGWDSARDKWWHELIREQSADCPAEEMDAEDPLFILYTSGSTGKPKGVLHTTGGYLLGASLTHNYVFDHRPDDTYWCTADIGWITGHSYILYGPLANGATSLMFEGVPTYPDAGRFWDVCDKYQVNVFYTAPTAIRALMKEGTGPVEKYSLESLRLLGTVGEPINPEAWEWYHKEIGKSRCPIVDTWWQTETGGIMISPLPGITDAKPGSCTRPLPGVVPDIVDEQGNSLGPNQGGLLVMRQPWPHMLRSLYGDHQRFIDTYFSKIDGCYFAGDGARRDDDGYYWVMGRVDDVLNVSGHRLSAMEIESALVSHPAVVEAAVVGFPHDLKGEGICCFVIPSGDEPDQAVKDEIVQHVRKQIGAIATPDQLRFTSALPKTRSGKIMRRLLRDIAADRESTQDTTTLEDLNVLAKLRGVDEE